MLRFAALCLIIGIVIAWAVTPVVITGRAYVVDGDTLTLQGRYIRLYGIDAPELDQYCDREPCGAAAKAALARLVYNKVISCEKKDTDRYNRVVAICRTPTGVDIGETMVINGQAVAYLFYSKKYEQQQIIAGAAKAGLWNTNFTMPWIWRQRNRMN